MIITLQSSVLTLQHSTVEKVVKERGGRLRLENFSSRCSRNQRPQTTRTSRRIRRLEHRRLQRRPVPVATAQRLPVALRCPQPPACRRAGPPAGSRCGGAAEAATSRCVSAAPARSFAASYSGSSSGFLVDLLARDFFEQVVELVRHEVAEAVVRPPVDDLLDLRVGDVRALEAPRLGGVGRHEEHVAACRAASRRRPCR